MTYRLFITLWLPLVGLTLAVAPFVAHNQAKQIAAIETPAQVDIGTLMLEQ